ncbi:MAG: YigZ family protein [Crocinitomicaceae bacterium]|nr:YigZ family protein [Crocinitomicaceae bacterium]
MTSRSTYKTVKQQSEGLYKEKGSKFIAYAVACYTEEEAKQYIEKWRKEHYQSRHVCWAYRFGLDKKQYRANDDGEPTNSAGAPILGQILAFDLTNVLIGVVRYFGGVKLGVGGLIHAYKEAAFDALQNATIIEIEVFHHIRIHFTYTAMPEVMNWLKRMNIDYSNQQFEVDCQLDAKLPLEQKEVLKTELLEINDVELTELGEY